MRHTFPALVVCALLCGCGTVENINGEFGHDFSQGPIPVEPKREIYGGLITSQEKRVRSVHAMFEEPSLETVFTMVARSIDVPLCAVADTLTLPITVPAFFRALEEYYDRGRFEDQSRDSNDAATAPE